MAEPTLTQRRLNRALLARQLLLERVELPIPAALERIGGIQNQYAPNAYIRLWSCLVGFRRGNLTSAYEDARVVQGTLMRGTIHAVAAGDYHPFVAAIAPTQRQWADRVHKAGATIDRAPYVARVRERLADGPVRRPELARMLDDAPPSVRQSIDTDAEILRVPPQGTWERRRADLCALADERIDHRDVTELDGLRHLAGRYLAAFGPASVADVASFLGTKMQPAKAALAEMDLRRYRDESGHELLDVADGELPDADAPAPVRFLPTWDAVLLVHARRTHVLPEAYRPLVFHSKMPPSYPTFLLDGQVAGTWRWDDGEIRLSAFRRLSRAERRELEEEAHRLAAFHGPDG